MPGSAAAARRNRRAYHHGDLRAALIAASTELVRTGGAAAFSLRAAARSVGVDVAACYRHFRDRQDVLVTIAQHGLARLGASFARERGLHARSGPRATLLAFARTYLDLALREPAEFRVMFGESGGSARDVCPRPPRAAATAYEQTEQVAADYLLAARLPLSAAALANMLWAISHGVCRLIIDGAIALTRRGARQLLERSVEGMLAGLVDPTGGLAPRPAARAVPTPGDLAPPIEAARGVASRPAARAVAVPTRRPRSRRSAAVPPRKRRSRARQ
jgi:AcrR family transcriptional regulator